jgi:hypothetical protein
MTNRFGAERKIGVLHSGKNAAAALPCVESVDPRGK